MPRSLTLTLVTLAPSSPYVFRVFIVLEDTTAEGVDAGCVVGEVAGGDFFGGSFAFLAMAAIELCNEREGGISGEELG